MNVSNMKYNGTKRVKGEFYDDDDDDDPNSDITSWSSHSNNNYNCVLDS